MLWIVPNEAIYSQTLRTLRDRQHPYRQTLDRAAAGKVKILEKGDPLNRADVEANLCIMVLMLQSSNRQNQEALKLFQDRGDVHGFTPAEGEQDKHRELLERIPNLRTGAEGQLVTDELMANAGAARFDPAYAVRMLSDLVPNAYVARELVGRVLARLGERGFDEAKIGGLSAFIIDELRKRLGQWRDEQAARLFAERLDGGQIEFRIRGDDGDWIMPDHLEMVVADGAPKLLSETGGALKRSLFLPVYAAELNADETKVAVYLDARDVIKWWHRNGTGRGGYALRGWRRGRVYPDFVFAALKDGKGQRLVALESKGDQLDNLDTAYKRVLLEKLSKAYAKHASAAAGALALESESPDYEAAVVLFSDMAAKLPELVQPSAAKDA